MSRKLLPIALSLSASTLNPQNRQGNDGMVVAPSAFDPNADEETRKRVFERDGHDCQYCGYHSEKFHLVHLRDGNPRNKNDDNLVTACIFCHQCFHIDQIANMKSGVLIWMPEISQAQLHHLARSIYVARITQGPMTEIARNSLEMIMKRREEAIERIKTDDPNILSTVLRDYIDRKHYQNFNQKLDGIRLFPLDRSKDGPFSKMMPNDWPARYKSISNIA
jgi:intracellular multiplication protein IcmJ